MRLPLLRTLILINAIATLAAGAVLFVVPAPFRPSWASPSRRIRCSWAWLLGAAEIGIAALCIGAVHSPSRDVHQRLDERFLLGSVVQSAKEQLVTITLIVFHAASATSGWSSEPS